MYILGILSTLSILLLFYILARLSERFGTVIKMAPIFRYYYVAAGFVAISLVSQILTVAVTAPWVKSPWFLILSYYLPTAIGVTIGLFITWRYWSWLVTERDG